MIVRRESTIIDYNAPFDQGLRAGLRRYSCLINLLLLQVQDAQVAMKLYTMHKKQWERQLKEAKFKYSTKQHAIKQDR